jgi:uncharacterized membrane protein
VSAPHADQIINGYLARLKQAVYESGVPADRGRDIVDDIERHIREARASFGDETDADLLNLIERLGDPVAIVADDRTSGPKDQPHPSSAPVASAVGGLEIAAVVLTLLFWPLGVALAIISPVWTRREKQVVGILLVTVWGFALFVLPILLAAFAGTGIGHHWIFAFVFAALLTPVVAAIYLATRLAQRHRVVPA